MDNRNSLIFIKIIFNNTRSIDNFYKFKNKNYSI